MSFVASAALLAALACSASDALPPVALAPTSPDDLFSTLVDLSAFGEKRAGTEAGRAAGAYVRGRFEALGLQVEEEEFHFPRYDRVGATLTVMIDGRSSTPAFEVFDGAGTGQVEGEVVFVASARSRDFEGKDVIGKIALLERDPALHRSIQLKNIAAHGGTGAIYVSNASDNLRQVGTVRGGWESKVAIPVVTIGATDGEHLRRAATEHRAPRATLSIAATMTPATGRNIVALIEGTDPARPTIVVGAHYDTWFSGSTDNGGGVAALLALAERRSKRPRAAQSLLFVAYDGEEIGLYGGYEFLRRHVVLEPIPITAIVHFETPAAKDSSSRTLARSWTAELGRTLEEAGGDEDYRAYLALGLVPAILGGTIPTDIRGLYRSGIPTVLTSVESPYYHTDQDTPDKVDVEALARAVDHFDEVIGHFLERGPTCCSGRDPELWRATVTHATRPSGELAVDVTVVDSDGSPVPDAAVEAWLLYDDFFSAGAAEGKTNSSGRTTLVFPPEIAKTRGNLGKRFLDVTAGRTYPLAETLSALP